MRGTVGHRVLSGETTIHLSSAAPGASGGATAPEAPLHVRATVLNFSFSGHADGKGVMQMVRRVSPRAVVLVHGEAGKMELFKQRVVSELGLPCHNPPNHSRVR